jgi:hypothetical protein
MLAHATDRHFDLFHTSNFKPPIQYQFHEDLQAVLDRRYQKLITARGHGNRCLL